MSQGCGRKGLVATVSTNSERKAKGMTSARTSVSAATETRWVQVARKIEQAASYLCTQGVLVRRQRGGRCAWVLRFRTRDQGRTKLQSIYIGGEGEPELVRRARRLLAELRVPSRWRKEIGMFVRCVRAAKQLARRLTGL
jgi:hypothetical protein